MKTDLRNAGAEWVDQQFVVDIGLVSSRKPDDNPAVNSDVRVIFLTLVGIALGTWWILSPTRRFHQGFRRLVEAPKSGFGMTGPLRFGSWVSGRFKDRRVTLEIERPAEDVYGEVAVAMEVRAPDGAPWKDSSMTTGNPELSRATFDLEGRYGLILTLADGWLRGSFNSRPGVLFPGSFDEEQWRNTLAQMHVLAQWLERRQPSVASHQHSIES